MSFFIDYWWQPTIAELNWKPVCEQLQLLVLKNETEFFSLDDFHEGVNSRRPIKQPLQEHHTESCSHRGESKWIMRWILITGINIPSTVSVFHVKIMLDAAELLPDGYSENHQQHEWMNTNKRTETSRTDEWWRWRWWQNALLPICCDCFSSSSLLSAAPGLTGESHRRRGGELNLHSHYFHHQL